MKLLYPPFPTPPLTLDALPEAHHDVDVAVVGGNLFAAVMAYEFSRRGVACALLCPDSRLVDRSKGGLGLAPPFLGDNPRRLERALGRETVIELHRFVGAGVEYLADLSREHGVRCERTPVVMCARGDIEAAEIRATRRLAPELNLPLRSPAPGFLGHKSGCSADDAVLWEGGLLCDPFELSAKLVRAAQRRGALIGGGVEVVDEHPDEGHVRLTLDRGSIAASLVLYTDGRIARRLFPWLEPICQEVRVQQTAFPGEVGALDCPGVRGTGFEHWRPGPQGGVWMSGFRYMSPDLGAGLEPEGIDPAIQKRQEDSLGELLGEGLPDAVEARVWSRQVEISCDNLPLVGPLPGQRRHVILLGLGELDLALGAASARALVSHLVESGGAVGLPALFEPGRML